MTARLPINELLVGFLLLVAACISIILTRVPGGIALLWPGSAITAALLIRLPRVRWVSAAFCIAGALALSNVIVAHRPWSISSGFVAINMLEASMMIAAYRFLWRFPYPNISISQAASMTAIFGVAIPGIAAALGALFLHATFHTAWLDGWIQWWSSHSVGACLVGPPIILYSAKGLKRLVRPAYLATNVLTLLLCLMGCYLAIRYVRFPFVSIGLLLMVAAFQLGGFGASLMSLSVGLTITNLWAFGIRPLGLDPSTETRGTLLGLPIIAFLATVIPPIAVGLGSDARRAAANRLRASERRFRESMAHSPIGMLIADIDGTWRYANLALQSMLGYTEEEFRAMPPGGPSREDDWKKSESRWSRLLAGEIKNYNISRCFRHHDGRWVWTQVAVSLLRDEDGQPIHLIAQIESLEARQLAEASLATERERLRITLESISDAVITTDAARHVIFLNAAAEILLGLELKVVEGRLLDEVIHLTDPDTAKSAYNLIGQSAHHGRAFRRDKPCLLHRSDGSLCYVTDTVSPVLGDAATVTGLVIVLRDATAEVENGRDLRHRALHDSLTGLSNRANFADKLRQAFRRAQLTNRSATAFALDLDRFKAVNDSAGHAAGDAVLCKVAETCRQSVRASDTVARLGGDEFAIILENCSSAQAVQIAQTLLRALNPLIVEWGNTHFMVHASLGVAAVTNSMADEKAWLAAADEACYTAKRQGRATLAIAPPSSGDCIR